MEEIWKDIEGAEGSYQVSNLGRVRSFHISALGKIKKPRLDKDGYLIIDLGRKGQTATRRVHRLVALAFIPNPQGLPQVNHKNGKRDDPRSENLEWATYSTNHLHAYRVLGRKSSFETRQVIAEKSDGEGLWFPSIVDAEKHGAHRNAIYECLNGRQKQHHGMRWSYA